MNPHAPIDPRYMTPHPEHGGRESDRITLPYRGLADPDVISAARELYQKLQTGPRWENGRNDLLRAWRQVCDEMNIRGLTDDVTRDE